MYLTLPVPDTGQPTAEARAIETSLTDKHRQHFFSGLTSVLGQ